LQNFNSTQIWEADPVVSQVSSTSIGVIYYDNIAAAVSADAILSFEIGTRVHVDRYYSGGALVDGLNYVVAIGTGDNIQNHTLTNSNVLLLSTPKSELTGKQLKIKPSIDDFIAKSLEKTNFEQVRIGDGRKSVGTNTTDLVYKTSRNTQGGTDGSRQVTARFAVPIVDLVNSVDFTIQLNATYLAGLTIRGIATDDSLLPTASITNFTLTDNGAGNYSLTGFSPSGAFDYYGFEVQLTPVNTNNNATIHDEFFVIQNMTIVQNSNNLLAQTESLSGSTWAQNVNQALQLAFTTQTLNSANANAVYITHTQNISGSSYRYMYASPTGVSSNNGQEFTPFDLITAANFVSSGSVDLLVLETGTYTVTGVKPRNLFTIGLGSTVVLCPSTDGVLIDTSLPLLFSNMTAVGSHYEIVYTPTNNYNIATITAGSTSPKIIMETLNENFTQVDTAGAVDTTDWSFFWDNASTTFFIRFDGTQTDDVHVPEAGVLFNAITIGYFGAANIKMKGVQAHFLDIEDGDFYETYKCGTNFGNAAGDVFEIDNVDGTQVDDFVKKAQNDAFNYHGFGHTELFDCIGEYCKDDGVSHHDSCTGFIQGGRFDYNGKGGVIPAFGAYVECSNVSTTGNIGGSPNADDFNYGGFVCISADDDTFNTTLICHDCTGAANTYNFLSTGGKSNTVIYRGVNTSSINADMASLGWDAEIVAGRLDIIQTPGTLQARAGQHNLINVKI
jgi:hypothetical protein